MSTPMLMLLLVLANAYISQRRGKRLLSMLLLLNANANANANAYANREANVSNVDSHYLNAKAIRPMPILMSTLIQMPTLILTLMLSMRPPNANGNKIVKIVLIRILV